MIKAHFSCEVFRELPQKLMLWQKKFIHMNIHHALNFLGGLKDWNNAKKHMKMSNLHQKIHKH